ncbi:MAG: alpha/beta fold hydrolase [Bacteroidota bacterium]
MVTRIASNAIRRLTELAPFPQPPYIPVRYPVVLMHGFGLFAALRRGGMMHRIAIKLRLHGVCAYAPNVVPYNTIPVRAEMWRDRIRQVLTETGAERVHLIAHSMGGLDARYLIAKLGYQDHVASLTTISTPHRGSPLADLVLAQPERLRDLAADLVNWIGQNAMVGTDSDVHRAVSELTTEYVTASFNQEVLDHPAVQYASYAGACGKGTPDAINPILRPLNLLLYSREGVNDGYVSVESARWGEDRGTIPADHLRQIGLQVTPGGSFVATTFFTDVVTHLANLDAGLPPPDPARS